MPGKNAAEAPGYGGRPDVQPKMVTVDIALNEVDPASEAAAFVFHPGDLEQARAKREELLGNDDLARVQQASAEAELRLAEGRLASAEAEVANLKASIAASKPAAKGKAADE